MRRPSRHRAYREKLFGHLDEQIAVVRFLRARLRRRRAEAILWVIDRFKRLSRNAPQRHGARSSGANGLLQKTRERLQRIRSG